ncbi:putative fucosyltransferase [Trifolium repens]|nr:putative fucosyltransferase [Trifolium repens]
MEAYSTRLKVSFIASLVALSIFTMVTLMNQNFGFGLIKGFSKDMAMGEKAHKNVIIGGPNVATNEFGLKSNVTFDNFGGRNKSDFNIKSSKNIPLANSTSTPSKEITDDEKDKLLEGLLVSGFDEASCISRSQSHLYHKPSPHKPSPYLISKLRKYEELHRKCGPNTRAYNKDMKIIANSKENNTISAATTCKYIIWLPSRGGLGNQIISMASSFLYALLTNRVLIVQFGKDKEGLFCEPFINSTWLLSENSHFWYARNVVKYQGITEMEMTNKLYEYLPSAMHVNLGYSPKQDERFFHCDHSQFLLSKIPLVFLNANQYFVPSFFMTPIFEEELSKMFPEITSIFHHLGRYLFHPANEAWELITSFYQQHLGKANERIGLQVRVFNPNSTSHQVVMNQILNCTLENKLLPKVNGTINMSVSSTDKNKMIKKVVLVTSLYPQYGKNLKKMYQNKSTVTGEVIEVYQPSSENQQKIGDKKQNLKAWVEMYLLSLSDVLVTTHQSTFGYVAKALGNSIPWIFYNPVYNQTKEICERKFTYEPCNENKEICEREFTLEPCYHYPPLHYCDGKVIEDVASSFHNIRHCKDFPFGLKLVNSSI